MPTGNGHAIVFRVTPSNAYQFDWDDRFFAYAVASWTDGPPATLTLNTLAPASLKAAIDAHTSAPDIFDSPRLQIPSSGFGATPVSPTATVVSYADVSGQTVLTLDELPPSFVAPLVGDRVYASSDVVAPVANAALALCDGLGPSRIGGTADNFPGWEDTLAIGALIAIVEGAVDGAGARLMKDVQPGNITIDGSVADARGSDGPSGPELLWLRSVLVVQA